MLTSFLLVRLHLFCNKDCVEDTFLSKKRKSDAYFNTHEDSQDLILLRMIAKDTFSFNVFITSIDLRSSIVDFIAEN